MDWVVVWVLSMVSVMFVASLDATKKDYIIVGSVYLFICLPLWGRIFGWW